MSAALLLFFLLQGQTPPSVQSQLRSRPLSTFDPRISERERIAEATKPTAKPSTGIVTSAGERLMVRQMAACTAGRWPAQTRAIVLAQPNDDLNSILRRMPLHNCMSSALLRRSNTVTFRSYAFSGLLAEELAHRELATVAMPDLRTIARVERDAPVAIKTAKDDGGSTSGDWAMRVIGECAVRSNASGARDLIFSEIGAEENAAVSKFVPAMAGCMPPKSEVRFGRDSLRALAALSYYRLANAAGVLPQGKN